MSDVANLVYQLSTTTGTGNFTLTTATGYRTFSAAFPTSASNNLFFYVIRHQSASEYEVGRGYLSGGALVRETVIESSNSNALVYFSAGDKDVINDIPASLQDQLNTLSSDLDGKQPLATVLTNTTASFTTALESKLAGIESGAEVNTVDSVAGKTGAVTLVKGDVGLDNVDNTSDADKPISTATQTELDLKANSADLADVATSGSAADVAIDSTGYEVIAGTNAQEAFDSIDNALDAKLSNPLAVETSPSAPVSGSYLFARQIANKTLPAFIGPSGLDSALQPLLARNKIAMVIPAGNGTALTYIGTQTISGTGTATTANYSSTSTVQRFYRRIDYRVTTASTSAVAAVRINAGTFSANKGYFAVIQWGPSSGVATATNRAFAGMRIVASPTDINPSTMTNIVGMGWDSEDTNVQFLYNDNAGTASKVDLGSSFPRPTADNTQMYEIALFAPPGGTIVYYQVTDINTGATASGSVSTDIPSATQTLAPHIQFSVGGTSSVIGITLSQIYIETDY